MVKDEIAKSLKWGNFTALLLYAFHTTTAFQVALRFGKKGLGILLGKKWPSSHINVIKLLHGSLVLVLQPWNSVGRFEKKCSAPA